MKIMEEIKPQNSEIATSGGTSVERDERGRFLEGHKRLGGRDANTTDYRTDFRRAIKKIAKANKITQEEAMDILHRVGYQQAKGANYNFYKDIMDRNYGKAPEDKVGVAVQVNIGGDREEFKAKE
jgi:hypothetical protein